MFFKCIIILLFLNCVNSSKVLLVFPYPNKNHHKLGFKLASDLCRRNHEVIFVTPYPQKINRVQNLKEISVSEIVDKFTNANLANQSYENLHWHNLVGQLQLETVLNSDGVQNLINSKEKDIDLTIIDHVSSDGLAFIPYKLRCSWISFNVGETSNEFTTEFSIWQHIFDNLEEIYLELYHSFVVLRNQDNILKIMYPSAPKISDIIDTSSISLTVSQYGRFDEHFNGKNSKEISGFHIETHMNISNDIKHFFDISKEGIIVISGDTFFSENTRNCMLKIFSKIDQKILWDIDENIKNIPENVKIVSEVPNYLLDHPNVLLTISNGDTLNNVEAIHFGVPILGIPLNFLQDKNMKAVENRGYGLGVPLNKEFTEEIFNNTLHEILNNDMYKQTAKFLSKMAKDRLVKPSEEAIFWIEYVIRHNGATHLRSIEQNIEKYQKHLVLITVILVILDIILFAIFYYIIKHIIHGLKIPRSVLENYKKKDN